MPVKQAIFDKKNILVIGGAGFVGSNLIGELLKDSKVICLDNFATGDNQNIAEYFQNPDFRFINHNIVDPIALENFEELEYLRLPFQGVQEIYFLASPASPAVYTKKPIETQLANSVGLRNALDLAVKYQAKFLYASSPAVYGPGTGSMPVPEDYFGPVDQLAVRSIYAEAKRFGESLVNNYKQASGLDTKIVRIFNCYGPKMSLTDGRMIPELIHAAVAGTDMTVYGKETDVSSYFFIDDLLRAMIKLMNNGESGPINLASEWKITLGEVAQKIAELTKTKSKIVFAPRPPQFAAQPLADISLAKEKLSWFPIVLIDEGLQKTIDYLSAQEGIRRPDAI